MTSKISWELYRTFLSVLKEGSLSGAARALDIAQPTVGRHVAALEEGLGLVLFTRSQIGLMPTEAAQALRMQVEAMESTAAALERTAASQGEGVRGTVRITASEVVGVEVLPPIISALCEHHPDLKIELEFTNRLQDLLQREADIGVRMVRPQQEQLIARHVGEIELGLHARKTYLSRHGTPASVGDLAKHRLIGFDQETPFVRNASKAFPVWTRDAFSIRTDSDLVHLALLRAGAGIGICQAPLAKRDKSLMRILPDKVKLPLPTWVTMHEDLRNSPRCRVTFDALVEGLQEYLA